jgi:transcriptional regulator with XRE-family HTH domain
MKNKLPIKRKRRIGERFRAIRKSLRLEQRELAKDMGISQAIISQYEKGMTEIPLSVLEYFKKKHGISSDWVIFGIGEMKAAIKENLNGRKDKFLKLIKQTQKTLDSVGGDLKVIEKNLMKKKDS